MNPDPNLVHGMFGGLMRQTFPEATEVQLWGSSIVFNLDSNTLILRCAGEEKEVPMPKAAMENSEASTFLQSKLPK